MGDIAPALGNTWARAQVDSHLSHVIYWVRKGYPISNQDRAKITSLYNMIAGEDNAEQTVQAKEA